MKLFRYRENNITKPGILLDDKMYDASGFVKDYNEAFFTANSLQQLATSIQQNKTQLKQLAGNVIFDSCVARPSKIICIGLNYADHAKEIKATPPTEPVIFLKSTTALCGPNDDIIIPKHSTKTDWEVELGDCYW